MNAKNIKESGLTCGMCGACCRTIALTYSPEDINKMYEDVLKKIAAGEKMDWAEYDVYFIKTNFISMSRQAAEVINPKMKLWEENLYFYRCTKLERNLCTVHKSRPRLCRFYPLPVDTEIPIYSDKCVFAPFEKSITDGKYTSTVLATPNITLIIR